MREDVLSTLWNSSFFWHPTDALSYSDSQRFTSLSFIPAYLTGNGLPYIVIQNTGWIKMIVKWLWNFCPVNILVQEQSITLNVFWKMRREIPCQTYKKVSLQFTRPIRKQANNAGIDDTATSHHVIVENYVSKLPPESSPIPERRLL